MTELLAKIRRLFHRRDPIEYWCDPTDMPPQPPRADKDCWGCGVSAGCRHEWTCYRVPVDEVIAFLTWRPTPDSEEEPRHDH